MKRSALVELGILALTCIVTLLFLSPLLWALLTSFKHHRDVFAFPPKFIFTPTLANYVQVLRNSEYLAYMANSLVITTLSAAASAFVGALGAYGFTRFRLRGSKGILMWILSLRMIPPVAVLVPFYLMAVKTGLYDTRLGMAAVLLTVNLPLAIWLQMSFIRELPPQIEEAAMVDGCSAWSAFLRVVLPLEAPGIVATLIICFIFTWNEFPLSLVLAPQFAKTLPVSMTSWDTQRGLLWGQLMAAGMMAVAPILVFTAFVQKYLVRGMTLGSVTGE